MKSFSIHRTNRDGKDRIGVSIEIALIIHSTSISSCKDEYGPFPTSSLLYTIDHSFQDDALGRLH